MRTVIVALSLAIGGVAACASHGMMPDTAAYGQVASDLSAAAEAHRSASASFATNADCMAERDRYHARAIPLLDRMDGMSGSMDACMGSMGHHETPTMVDTCVSMRTELRRHMAVACTSATMADERAEANHHADRMTQWARMEMDRSARMGAMMRGGSSMMSGSCHM